MKRVTSNAGESATIDGAQIRVDRRVVIITEANICRLPLAGIKDLFDTEHRIGDLWKRNGRRVPMITRHDPRCPCGSAYVRRSETHHSCQYCGRVWPNEEVPA